MIKYILICMIASIAILSCNYNAAVNTINLKSLDGEVTIVCNKPDTAKIILLLIMQEQTIRQRIEDDTNNEYNYENVIEILWYNEKQYIKMYGEDWHETLQNSLEENSRAPIGEKI